MELEVCVKKSKSSKSDAEITLIKVSPMGSIMVNEISLSQFPECHINSITAPVVEYTESKVKLCEQSKLPNKKLRSYLLLSKHYSNHRRSYRTCTLGNDSESEGYW